MSIKPRNANQNLKILEDLQNKKQALSNQMQQQQQQTSSEAVFVDSSAPSSSLGQQSSTTGSMVSQRERTALQHALQTSFGSFVSQDSSFGNLVLPVLPRF